MAFPAIVAVLTLTACARAANRFRDGGSAGGAGFGGDANYDGLKNGVAWMPGAAGSDAVDASLLPRPAISRGFLRRQFRRISIPATLATPDGRLFGRLRATEN